MKLLTIGVVLLFVGAVLIVAGALPGVAIPATLGQLGWLCAIVGLILILVAVLFVGANDAHAVVADLLRSSWGLIQAGGLIHV